MRVAPFASLDPASYREIVRRALAEDVRWGDVTTDAVVEAEHIATRVIVVRASCVMAGLDVAALHRGGIVATGCSRRDASATG